MPREFDLPVGTKESKLEVAKISATNALQSLSSATPETFTPVKQANSERAILAEKGYETLTYLVNDNNVRVITANSKEMGGIVTIKILSKSGNSGHCRKKGIHQEIEMMRQLNHSNLIKYYRYIETKKRYYLVMECAQNGTLSDLIRKVKYLDEERAKNIYMQLVDVLSYCNARGATHHDIKSENLLFSDNDVLKISLCGFSYRNMLNHCVTVDSDCESNNPIEPDYADIFGSGIVLFEMVYGKLPSNYTTSIHTYSLKNIDFPTEPVVSIMCKELIFKLVSPEDDRMTWTDISNSDWMKEAG